MEDTPPDALKAITMPTLVLCRADDNDNGSADRLAGALPNAERVTIPGTHMSSDHARIGARTRCFPRSGLKELESRTSIAPTCRYGALDPPTRADPACRGFEFMRRFGHK
jgi:hypothetical protein